jgi:hypothetical protein
MKTKQYLLVTVVGVSLFAALMNLPAVLGVARNLINLVLPIIAGSILALFISVPMNGIKKQLEKMLRKSRKHPSNKAIHICGYPFNSAEQKYQQLRPGAPEGGGQSHGD